MFKKLTKDKPLTEFRLFPLPTQYRKPQTTGLFDLI